MSEPMKVPFVTDAFMHEHYYRDCFAKFPEYEIVRVLHFGSHDRMAMREHFEMMKPDAYFINCARSHLIDNQALYECLRDGRIMGAAFDVYAHEPIVPDEPYASLDNVTLSNHRGGDTENCYSDSPAMLLTYMNDYLAGGTPKYLVNPQIRG